MQQCSLKNDKKRVFYVKQKLVYIESQFIQTIYNSIKKEKHNSIC